MSPPSNTDPLVSVIIPAFNKWEYTLRCLVCLAQNTRDVSYETIVVDNASSDDTRHGLPLFEGVRIQRNEENLGFSKACNQGARLARGRYLLFLNNDTQPLPGWLPPLVTELDSSPSIAAAGSQLLFPDGTVQHGGVAVLYGAPLPISPVHMDYRAAPQAPGPAIDLQVVTAACVLVRADAFREVGGFDEGYINGYEDVDLCFKLRERGKRIRYVRTSVLIHHESVSDGRFKHNLHNTERLHQRWMTKLETYEMDYRAAPPPPDPAPQKRPAVTVVVLAQDGFDSLAPCLESALVHLGAKDVLVVDGGTSGLTTTLVSLLAARSRGRLRALRLEGWPGVGAAVARAAQEAKFEHVVVLSHEVRAVRGFIDRLLHHWTQAHDKRAVVGGALDATPARKGTNPYAPEVAPVPFAPVAVPVPQLERYCVLAPRDTWRALEREGGRAIPASAASPLLLAPEVLLRPLVAIQPSPAPGAAHG